MAINIFFTITKLGYKIIIPYISMHKCLNYITQAARKFYIFKFFSKPNSVWYKCLFQGFYYIKYLIYLYPHYRTRKERKLLYINYTKNMADKLGKKQLNKLAQTCLSSLLLLPFSLFVSV